MSDTDDDKTDWSIPAAQRLAEGASIIAAAQPDAETASEHDILYLGTPKGLSVEARERLAVLGWFVDSQFDCMAFFT